MNLPLGGLAGEGFALGLSTGVYCLTACAPIFVPFLVADGRRWQLGLLAVAEFLAGRLAAYLLFALAVSALSLALPPLPSAFLGWSLLASGLLLMVYGLARSAPRLSFCLAASSFMSRARLPLWFGFLTGINLCPPFAAGMARLLELRDIPAGAVYFCGFFAGTTLYMLPLAALAPLARVERLKSIATLACVLAGAWYCLLGLLRLA